MSYFLGTTHDVVRFYRISDDLPKRFELLPVLDIKRVSKFPDKRAAKVAAMSLGITQWRYVKM